MRGWLPAIAAVLASICAGFSAYFFVSGRFLVGLVTGAAFAAWYLVFVVAAYRGRTTHVLEIVILLRPRTTDKEAEDEQGS